MPTGSRTTSRRTTGLLVAAAFALIAAGVVIFIAFASRSGPQAPAVPANVVDIGKAPDAAADGSIQQTGASRIQFADKQDSSRLASELSYDKLDPVGQGYYTLAQPRAWLYMRDGRTLYIRADTGRVKMPSRNAQPESGEFRGKVVVRMFAPPIDKDAQSPKPINPDTDTPALLAVTESMNFDSVLMELQTSDPLTISTRQVLFNGTGMLVRFNQVHERIELLRTAGKYIRYNPTLKDDGPGGTGSGGPGGTGGGGSPVIVTRNTNTVDTTNPSTTNPQSPSTTLVPPTPPKETLYRALFSDNLTVTETTRTLTADTLEVFARTLDNQLPENAFGIWPEDRRDTGVPPVHETRGNPGSSTATANSSPSPAPTTNPTPPDPYPPLFISAKDHDIVLTWTGPLVLTPILSDTPPVELSRGNHFAARFSADKPGAQSFVLLTDAETSARGQCAQIEYAATTCTLAFLSGPASPLVTLDAPNSGSLEVPNFKIDLGSGVSQALGAGRIAAVEHTSKPSDPPTPTNTAATNTPPPRQITWTEQADFNFRTNRGRITAALDSAAFTGKVLAKDQVSMIAGDFLRAEFMPAGRQLTALKHVHVEGNIIGIAGTRSDLSATRDLPPLDPYLTADTLDVGFTIAKSDPNQTEPARAVALGSAKAATRDAWITADQLEATLGHDQRDNFTATGLVAVNAVHFERADGVIARADKLIADPLSRTADLTGQVVALSRDNSTIVGTQMHLAETESATGGVGSGTLRVHGPGSFEHTQSAATDPTRITATWTRALTFDNASGLIEADGDTTVIAASALSTQTAHSSRLQLFLTPAGETSPTATTDPTLAVSNDRRLLKAEIIGEGDTNANAEVRRYSAPLSGSSERILDQVMYIEGPRIIADDVAGTISVPGAGRAIVRDQRTAPAPTSTPPAEPTLASASAPASAPLPTTSRGTSRFTWAESMLFTRSTGLLSMKKDVELVHLPLGSEQAIRLVAMQLDAHFNIHSSGPDNTPTPRTADLVRAEAIGAVYAEFAQQKLLADRFNYDALNATAEAIADAGNRVTLYDEKKGPIVARKLFWDLKNDRIEITEPAPVTTIR